MKNVWSIFRRELRGYFATPVAYVFIVSFLIISGVMTFLFPPKLFEEGQSDLLPFFGWLPILFLFLIPAISMRLWAEERRGGTIELLLTLPISLGQAVLGKFLAAWFFVGVSLALTLPLWITVNYLGTPDNAVILASYLGGFLMAGAYLAIGSCISALTKNQVIAFVLTLIICLVFVITDLIPELNALMPDWMRNTYNAFSFPAHFDSIAKGVIDLRDLIFFFSLIAFALFANALVIDAKKAE